MSKAKLKVGGRLTKEQKDEILAVIAERKKSFCETYEGELVSIQGSKENPSTSSGHLQYGTEHHEHEKKFVIMQVCNSEALSLLQLEKRIHADPNYGICRNALQEGGKCKSERPDIPFERLLAVPAALYCCACGEELEKASRRRSRH